MLRLKQTPLAKIQHLCIFTPETLQVQGTSLCNVLSWTHSRRILETHTVTARKGKEIRDHYNLRWSRFHFQVCLRDESDNMHPTNAMCCTERIYEYDRMRFLIDDLTLNIWSFLATEYRNLPEAVRQLEKPKQRKGRKPVSWFLQKESRKDVST